MAYNVAVPFFEPGERLPARASGAVSGKTFVKLAGDRDGGSNLAVSDDISGRKYPVQTAGAGDLIAGVAEHDAGDGQGVGLIADDDYIVPVIAGAPLTAGEEIESDANGHAIPLAAGKRAGICMTSAAANDDAEIKLRF